MPETADVSLPIKSDQATTRVVDGLQLLKETLPKGDHLRKIGELADKLLRERAKDTATIKGFWTYTAEEMIAQGKSPEQNGIDRLDTETRLALLDKRTNTSFVIETHKPNNSERYITLRFQTLGENKGRVGGGVIRLNYKDGQREPINIQTEKVDNVHLLQSSDEEWFIGDPGIYGPYFNPRFEHTELGTADVAELFNRLSSDQIETDTTLTEKTAKFADMNHRGGHARRILEIARHKGNQEEIGQAEKVFQEAVSEWEEMWATLQGATGREELMKRDAFEAGRSQRNADSSAQDERGSALKRGIIPQEVIEDPSYPKIREDERARMLLEAKTSSNQTVTIQEDELDRRVVEEYAKLTVKREELQKLSNMRETSVVSSKT